MSRETCKETMARLQKEMMTVALQILDQALDELFATMRAEPRIDRFAARAAVLDTILALRERVRERATNAQQQMTAHTRVSAGATPGQCRMLRRLETAKQD